MNLLNRNNRKKTEEQAMREKWLSELKIIKKELDANEILFNMTDDFDLTDYAIHERTALEARYSYLIRLIRSTDEAENAVNITEKVETELIEQDITV